MREQDALRAKIAEALTPFFPDQPGERDAAASHVTSSAGARFWCTAQRAMSDARRLDDLGIRVDACDWSGILGRPV